MKTLITSKQKVTTIKAWEFKQCYQCYSVSSVAFTSSATPVLFPPEDDQQTSLISQGNEIDIGKCTKGGLHIAFFQ